MMRSTAGTRRENTMSRWSEDEIRAAYRGYVETRERIDRGELPWTALAEFFTEDAVFCDPAWGRVEGLDDIRRFWTESMAGLEDWKFPEVWTMVEGNRVVTMWWQRMGEREDGSYHECPGFSVLYYAGDGKFCYELDLLNMAHVIELIREMPWVAPPGFNTPPAEVDRDISLPKGREHLAA
jgi:ketosteroid isomerase-like protein